MKSRILCLLATTTISIGCLGCSSAPTEGISPSRPYPAVAASTPLAREAKAQAKGPLKLGERPTLSDYLAYAALNNAGLRVAFDRWRAALERVPQVRALPDPRFTYRYFIEEVETRVGAQRQGLGIAQMFPWFGKLELRGNAAAEAANAERQRFEAEKLKLFYAVKDAYYEYYYLWRAIRVVKDNIQLAKHMETVARTRYKVAAAGHPDVIRAQVELGKLDDRLRTLQDLGGPITARLNAALNRPAAAPIPWPAKMAEEKVSFTDQQLLNQMARSNPDLKALAHEIAQNKTRVELAKKDYLPDVTVGLDYIETTKSVGGRHPSDDGKDPMVAMVSVNLPIWWDKLAAGLREARRRHRRATHSKVEKLNSLSARLKLVLYRFRDAERKIDLYRDTLLPKARQSLKATETAFRAAKGSFFDLIDAERILLAFQLAHERALANHAQRLAELEMLVGKQIPRNGNANTPKAVEKDENPDR